MVVKNTNPLAIQDIRDEYTMNHNWPWIVAWSGGKDSSLVLHLIIEALSSINSGNWKRQIVILTNDTLVESPFVDTFVKKQIDILNAFIAKSGLPITIHQSVPELNNTFWVNLIGRGYPAPNASF